MPHQSGDDAQDNVDEEDDDMTEELAEDDRFGKLKYLAKCEELGIRPVSQILKYLETEELHLGHYGIGLNGIKALTQALQVNKNVSLLRLNDNNIPDEGVRLLAEALITFGLGVTELDLSENKLGLQGCKSLADLLLQSKPGTLVVLHLNKTKISDKECMHLAQALENNTTLRSLDISSNLIGERAGHAIGNMLTILNLAWCGMQDTGAAALGQALADNKGLVEVDLTGNGISATGAAAFAAGVLASHSLASVSLDSNDIREEGGQAVLDCVNNNQGLVKFRIDNTNTTEQLRAAVEGILAQRRAKNASAPVTQ